MATLASTAQLAARLGLADFQTATETSRATSCLEAASALIREAADDDLDSPTDRIVQICVDVALRAFTNPEAWGQRSLSDENKSFDRAGVDGGAIVYLTSAERRSVLKAVDKSTMQSLTLETPYSGPATSSTLL